MKEITAQRTREIVTYVRVKADDLEGKIIKTQDEIFAELNDCIDEIAKETFCHSVPDITTPLVPDQTDYVLINVLDTPQTILRIKQIRIINPDKSLSKPLVPIPQNVYNMYSSQTGIYMPKFYYFDGQTIFIWKPYSQKGYQINIVCDRVPTESEYAGYDADPVIPILYDKYLKYGTLYRLGSSINSLSEKLNIPFFESEYRKFKTAKIANFTTEPEHIPFNELNLPKVK